MPPPDTIITDIEPGMPKHRFVHGGAVLFVAQVCKCFIRLASQIVIARLLVPADFGLIAMVAPILALVQLIGDLGLGQAVVLQRDIRHAEVSSLFWFGLLLNTVLALLLAMLSPLIARMYDDPRIIPITLALAALLPVSGLATQHTALLNRNMRFIALAVLDISLSAVSLVTGVAAARTGWGYWSLIAAMITETVVGVIITWSFSRWRPNRPSYDPRVWSLVRIGGHITAYNLAGYATTSFDNILIGVTRGEDALGLYDRGYKLVVQPIAQLIAPVGRIAVPLLSQLGPGDIRYKRTYLDMVHIMLLIGVPGIILTMLMARPIVLFLLGPRWVDVTPIFAWLCFGSLASSIYSSTFWLFVTQGRSGQQVFYVTATSVISVLSFMAGLPWGPAGVAEGAALSFVFLSTPLACWGATKNGAVSMTDLGRALLPFLFAGLATVGALEIAKTYLRVTEVALLGASLPISYGTFLTVLLCLPNGNSVVRKAWHLGMLLIRGA
jgi:PST family polysaccharide transporter